MCVGGRRDHVKSSMIMSSVITSSEKERQAVFIFQCNAAISMSHHLKYNTLTVESCRNNSITCLLPLLNSKKKRPIMFQRQIPLVTVWCEKVFKEVHKAKTKSLHKSNAEFNSFNLHNMENSIGTHLDSFLLKGKLWRIKSKPN